MDSSTPVGWKVALQPQRELAGCVSVGDGSPARNDDMWAYFYCGMGLW